MSSQEVSESCLLQAVRETLRLPVESGGAGFGEGECNVEIVEDDVPATVGQRYASIVPGDIGPGEHHAKSGGVEDYVFSLTVLVIRRITNVPRDRTRDQLLGNLGVLRAEVGAVISAIDWSYALTNLADARIEAETGSTEGFMHPLVFLGAGKVRAAPEDMFAAGGTAKAGLMRVLSFGNARRITTR